MSRVGRSPIAVPPSVEVSIQGSDVAVKGPKGQLSASFHRDMSIVFSNGTLSISRPTDNSNHRALHGLTRSLIFNMVEGVTKGFQKTLELSGVGYRAQKAGEKLILQVGYSHPVDIVPPPGVSLAVEGTNRIIVQGIDKQLIGEVAAQIRTVRPCEPYQGKGIRYSDERIRRKAGKAGKVAAKKK